MVVIRSFALAAALLVANAAQAVVVPGTSNPFLAGQPNGTVCCHGDNAPDQSPVLALAGLLGGQTFTFTATGGTTYANVPTSPPSPTPDGDSSLVFNMSDYQDGNAAVAGANNAPDNALVGVFLTDAVPTAATRPSSRNDGTSFLAIAPQIAQIFFIGDGLTGTGSGTRQQFVAPVGATRLFLGTFDIYEWKNNGGNINVTINALSNVPEPASWAMMISGFGMIGIALRRRRRSFSFVRVLVSKALALVRGSTRPIG